MRAAYKNWLNTLQSVQPRIDTSTFETILAMASALVAKARGRVCDTVSDPAFEVTENFTVEHWIPPPAYRTMQGESELV